MVLKELDKLLKDVCDNEFIKDYKTLEIYKSKFINRNNIIKPFFTKIKNFENKKECGEILNKCKEISLITYNFYKWLFDNEIKYNLN